MIQMMLYGALPQREGGGGPVTLPDAHSQDINNPGTLWPRIHSFPDKPQADFCL
jgi:hypothetical protein